MHEQQPAVLDFCAELTQKSVKDRTVRPALNAAVRPRNLSQKFNAAALGNVLYLSSIYVLKIYLENCAEKVLSVQTVRTSISVLYGLEICAGYGLY